MTTWKPSWEDMRAGNGCDKDFKLLRAIGRGAYGTVHQAIHKKTGEYYALKVLSKHAVYKNKNLNKILNEISVMSAIKFEFLAELHYFFHDESFIYFASPYCPGGDLFIQLRKYKKFPESVARFYISQVILALEYLHSLDLVHRDVKPENVVISYDGFLKLTDFGFCKKIDGRTYTFCGTIEYMAPEILEGRGYGKSVDWWAMGIMLFELVFGTTPFERKNKFDTMKLIKDAKFKMPRETCSTDLEDLVKALLQPKFFDRIGQRRRGTKEIKDHKFFHGVNWKYLINKRVSPPFRPQMKSIGDSTHFKKMRPEPDFLSASNEFGSYFDPLDAI